MAASTPQIFGVRHLSPAAAWHLRQLLDRVRPKLVLIDQFEGAANEKASVAGQLVLACRVWVVNDLVRVGSAAIDHGTISVRLQLGAGGVLGSA